MRTLTIRQPWAWLIVQGHMDVENRDWSTDYVGPLLVHASKTVAKGEYAQRRETLQVMLDIKVPELQAIELGGIVGMVDLLGCVDDSDSRWYAGGIAWLLSNPRPLPFHPCKGGLQLFHTPLADLGLREDDFPMGRRERVMP